MALAELLDALRRQGALNRADELERARGEAERIREASHRLIEVRTREHRARVEAEAGEDARRTLARAEGEAREAILSARRHLLRRVEEAVRARLSHADGDPTYVASLPS
ncbi:MAG: V-type ATP synthase subunit E family protein, partial [Gemmatimonadota bacterium]|nr:V-type ATP synthase subunit E family protein [Gemmatimonadota bacterium]